MKELIRRWLQRLWLEEAVRRAWWSTRLAIRRSRGIEASLRQEYFSENESWRLHLGSGVNLLDGWLNTDLYPSSLDVLHLDATRRFPFEDDTFEAIYSEHLIEHVKYLEAEAMLRECLRVLKPGGRIRIATPDLGRLLGLYTSERSEIQERFIGRMVEMIPEARDNEAVFVINNNMRAWGHQFIYDEPTLSQLMEAVGFTSIVEWDVHDSDDEALRGIAHEQRLEEGLVRYETLTLEGAKPLASLPSEHGDQGVASPGSLVQSQC